MDVPEDLVHALMEVHFPLRLDAVIESVVDGLLVRGSLEARMRMSCARCLVDIDDDVRTDVVELFADPAAPDGDELEPGYEIHEGTIDLDTLLRDALVPAVPYQPLCRAECQGLCASCGINLNEAACDCADTVVDPRWAPLEGLRLPPDGVSS